MAETLPTTQDYENDFDPEWFIKKYIDVSSEKLFDDQSKSLLFYTLNKCHELFETGSIKGQRLLDVGTGPTIHTIISASDHVTEIYLSDIATKNLEILSDWLHAKRDLDTLSFNYILKKQNSDVSVVDKQNQIRSRVKAILPINITRDDPFTNGSDVTEFDVITSKLCLESASRSMDDYRRAVKNLMSMLKPGGHAIIVGILKNLGYRVGDFHFSGFHLEKDDVKKAFEYAGAKVLRYDIQECSVESNDERFNGIFILVVTK